MNNAPNDNTGAPCNVFLLEQCRLDVTGLQEYGDTICLFGPHRSKTSMFQAREFSNEILQALQIEGYDPSIDYIALAGNTVALAVAVAAVSEYYGPARYLAFDARQRKYLPLNLGVFDTLRR